MEQQLPPPTPRPHPTPNPGLGACHLGKLKIKTPFSKPEFINVTTKALIKTSRPWGKPGGLKPLAPHQHARKAQLSRSQQAAVTGFFWQPRKMERREHGALWPEGRRPQEEKTGSSTERRPQCTHDHTEMATPIPALPTAAQVSGPCPSLPAVPSCSPCSPPHSHLRASSIPAEPGRCSSPIFARPGPPG